jgi:uncharacterized membrane protein
MEQKKMIRAAVFAALTAVATMVINIPLPNVQGFVNIGDTIVLIAGLTFGPTVGALAGAIGSSLADILLGYGHWAPWTFVIKGLEGLIAGWLARKPFVGAPAGAGIMVFGYFIAGTVFYGIGPAVASLPGDLVQGAVSAILALLLVFPLRKYLQGKVS